MDPLERLVDIQNAKVLRLIGVRSRELGRVRRGKDALAGVEVDIDDTLVGKVGTLDARVAAGARDHGAAVHVDQDGELVARLGRPDVEVQAVLILARPRSAPLRGGLGTGRPVGDGGKGLLGRDDGLRSAPPVVAAGGGGERDAEKDRVSVRVPGAGDGALGRHGAWDAARLAGARKRGKVGRARGQDACGGHEVGDDTHDRQRYGRKGNFRQRADGGESWAGNDRCDGPEFQRGRDIAALGDFIPYFFVSPLNCIRIKARLNPPISFLRLSHPR